MAKTYNPSLPTNKDWVRFLTGDREETTGPAYTMTKALLLDEEIAAVVAEEANKWLAAARCGEVILARGKGAISKAVDGLSISWGDSPESAYRAHIKGLRVKGCDVLLISNRHFRMMV